MKTLFLSLLLAQTTWAANPDQDLIVDLVRERFAASSPATLENLQLGKTWGCVIYSGQRGVMPNYNTIRENFKFKKVEGKNQVVNEMNFPYTVFDLNSTGIVSTKGDSSLHVRVAKNGALVFEHVSTQPKTHKAYRAITNSKLRAIDYVYCR